MGQHWPIVCLHLEPVLIFAVPIILHFLIEETQHLMRKCLPTLCIAHIIRREKMYIVKSFQNGYLLLEMNIGRVKFIHHRECRGRLDIQRIMFM